MKTNITNSPELQSEISAAEMAKNGFKLFCATVETKGRFMMETMDYGGALPLESGRVVCRLIEKDSAVIDLRWGKYGHEGSILATFQK